MSEPLYELKKRCEAAGLEFEWDVYRPYLDREDNFWITLPKGRTSYILFSVEDGVPAQRLLQQPFENYKGLEGFEASWSSEQRIIECTLLHGDSQAPLRSGTREFKQVLKSLGQEMDDRTPLDNQWRIEFDSSIGLSISIGSCSIVHGLLHEDAYGYEADIDDLRWLTLQIRGIEVTTHDEAVKLLQKVGDSLLFQLDLSLGLLLMLRHERDLERGGRHTTEPKKPDSLPPVKFQYDREPMSLYWYGRSAWDAGMPLLAFLAFYQVLEYHYPAYSPSQRVEALRAKLGEIAGASVVSDSDVDAVLDAIGTSKRKLFPEERKQLMDTIKRCVTPEEINDFLAGDEARMQFYRSHNSSIISNHALPVGDGTGKRGRRTDYRNKVAERVYEIRNRIVHTKDDRDELGPGPLLPFDEEMYLLNQDVGLVRFLAQKVLIASGRPLDSRES